jgi:hypothetical protein
LSTCCAFIVCVQSMSMALYLLDYGNTLSLSLSLSLSRTYGTTSAVIVFVQSTRKSTFYGTYLFMRGRVFYFLTVVLKGEIGTAGAGRKK